jgi:cytochrome c556
MKLGRGPESMHATRSSLAAALLTVVATALGETATVAADSAPEKLLEGRGLKRSGMLYVVDAEADFVPQVAKLQPSFRELKATYDKLFAVVQNQAEYDFLNDQWTLCNEQLRNVQAEIDAHPPLNNNELRQNWNNLLNAEKQLRYQYNELGREVNLRYRRLVSDGEKERLQGEFQKKREDFLAKSKELRARADKIKADYDALSRDDAVKKALDTLKLSTKARITLGPSPSYKKASAWLSDAVKTTSPESLTPKALRNKAKNAPRGKGTTPTKERSGKGTTPETRAKAPASGDGKTGTE